MSQDAPKSTPEIVALQLALLENVGGQTLQTRFNRFCLQAVEALTECDDHGEPLLEAGKARAAFQITIELTRATDDSLHFGVDHTVKEKMPPIPGRSRSAPFVRNVGLAQRVTKDVQTSFFHPAHGQPEPLTPEQAEDVLKD
jgi:hypothetical protein